MKVEKAGCILINLEEGKIGLVHRNKNNDYSFPKGHLEKGETLKECAIRETEEETGRKNHIIIDKEIHVLKYTTSSGEDVETYMYIAIDDGKTEKYIKEEDRENLKWVSLDEVKKTLTYDNLKIFWLVVKLQIEKIIKNNGVVSEEVLKALGI